MTSTGRQLLSTLGPDGLLTVEVVERTLPSPSGSQVLVRVEATPINPSDLGGMFAAADLDNATYSPGKVVAPMPEPAMRALAARIGVPTPIGIECAGTVIAAGENPRAQALLGKTVACLPDGAYATEVLVDAAACIPLPDGISAEQGASIYVNPMTALGFVETMRMGGQSGLVHTAAASNLGQMLVRICREDGIPLVNVVRSPAHVELLRGIGAEYVVDSSQADFMPRLIEAIEQTGAMLGFDAIGGGTMAGKLLAAMETVANKGAAYSRYGSFAAKKVFIYGALDMSPTILNRSFGFTWDLSGWLLMPFLMKFGQTAVERMRQRVIDGLTTTFASHYTARVTLDTMLERETVLSCVAKRTGEKYLVLPNG
ncbi:MAG: zinc-binding dehydrogenase [Novosphingobium sp.]